MKRKVLGLVLVSLLICLIAAGDPPSEVKAPLAPDKKQEIGPSKEYTDVQGILQLKVDLGLAIYFLGDLQENLKPLPGESVAPESELKEKEKIFAIGYLFSVDEKQCPSCMTEMEKMLESMFFRSKLAEWGKIRLSLASNSDRQKTDAFFKQALIATLLRSKAGIMQTDIASLLKKVHFELQSDIDFAKEGFAHDPLPIVVIFDETKLDLAKKKGLVYGSKGEKVNWSGIDRIILSAK